MANRARKNLARNIPLSIDEGLLAAIDRIAGDRNETRSLVMRKAIQEGLPLVKAGGSADVLTLDSELSGDVATVSKETKVTRNKVILESIRAGVHSVYWRLRRENIVQAQNNKPEEAEAMVSAMDQIERMDEPMSQQLRAALMERGAVKVRLDELLRHVPEAKRRFDLVNRLMEFRRQPGGGGAASGAISLPTDEVEWQVAMFEKYGFPSASWPKEEGEAREAVRIVQRQKESARLEK